MAYGFRNVIPSWRGSRGGGARVHIIGTGKQREGTQEDTAPKDSLLSDLLPPASPQLLLLDAP